MTRILQRLRVAIYNTVFQWLHKNDAHVRVWGLGEQCPPPEIASPARQGRSRGGPCLCSRSSAGGASAL